MPCYICRIHFQRNLEKKKKIAYDKITRHRIFHTIISLGHTAPLERRSLLKPHFSFDPLAGTSCGICISPTAAPGLRRKSLTYIKTSSCSVKCLNVMLSILWVVSQTPRLCVCVCVCSRERKAALLCPSMSGNVVFMNC